jgi:hypothetical protein
MIPFSLGQARARAGQRLSIALVLMVGTAGTGGLVIGLNRHAPERLIKEAAEQGWLLQGGRQDSGLLCSTIRDARLTWRNASDVSADIGRIEVQHWPWLPPRVTVFDIHVRLRGETGTVLRAISAAVQWGNPPVVVGPVDVTYDHRVLGAVELEGVMVRSAGTPLVLQAERFHVGRHDWRAVTLAFEPHKETFVIAPGDSVANARVQLSCFPSFGGRSRWLLDVHHQAARPLASRVGWELGSEFEASWIAGSVSLDIPDDAAEPVRGRMQFVLDGWPTGAPASATPLLGNTLSLLSNLVPATDGPGWELPRVELTMPVFKLAGKGHVKLGEHPHFSLEAKGERTCQQLRELLPPSEERERVEQFLDRRHGHAGQTAPSDQARLGVRWDHAAGSDLLPQWQFEPGCGLQAILGH